MNHPSGDLLVGFLPDIIRIENAVVSDLISEREGEGDHFNNTRTCSYERHEDSVDDANGNAHNAIFFCANNGLPDNFTDSCPPSSPRINTLAEAGTWPSSLASSVIGSRLATYRLPVKATTWVRERVNKPLD